MRTQALARLQRLHLLRCRLADAAAADRERSLQAVQAAEYALRELDHMVDTALRGSADQNQHLWPERAAALQAAAWQHEAWRGRRADRVQASEIALLQERAAVQEREQIGCILEKRKLEITADAARREQASLDDLFAITHIRSAKTMAF